MKNTIVSRLVYAVVSVDYDDYDIISLHENQDDAEQVKQLIEADTKRLRSRTGKLFVQELQVFGDGVKFKDIPKFTYWLRLVFNDQKVLEANLIREEATSFSQVWNFPLLYEFSLNMELLTRGYAQETGSGGAYFNGNSSEFAIFVHSKAINKKALRKIKEYAMGDFDVVDLVYFILNMENGLIGLEVDDKTVSQKEFVDILEEYTT